MLAYKGLPSLLWAVFVGFERKNEHRSRPLETIGLSKVSTYLPRQMNHPCLFALKHTAAANPRKRPLCRPKPSRASAANRSPPSSRLRGVAACATMLAVSRDLLLAIDNGTQSLRALLFDPQGNLLVQVRASGELTSLAEMREVIRKSSHVATYRSGKPAAWEDASARFAELRGGN